MTNQILSGQYIGQYNNVSTGLSSLLCLNIDTVENNDYDIFATIFSGPGQLFTASFRISNTNIADGTPVQVTEIEEYTLSENRFVKKHRNDRSYSSAEVIVTVTQQALYIVWKIPDGTVCHTVSLTSNQNEDSDLPSINLRWTDFHEYVHEQFSGRAYVFRGQPKNYRLRTSFHRSKRANISRYFRENIPSLQRYVSAIHPDFSSIDKEDVLLALLTLLQHHGYPTPILDWTLSPYVAAYFAFFYAKNSDIDMVRILAFDRKGYSHDFPQYNNITDMNLHVSFLDTPALHNPRCIPQQSVSCISTIDDIEKYIEIQESTYNKRYLSAFSLPIEDAPQTLSDLNMMGINHATLFPGLDGICSYMKYAHFGLF